jgi:hypothetical protein
VHDLAQRIREIEKRPLTWTNRATGERIVITKDEWDERADMSNVTGPFDSQMWGDVGESGQTRGEILDAHGLGFYRSHKSNNSRHQAAENIRAMLRRRAPDKDGNVDPGIAGLRFFSTCRTSIRSPDGETEETGPIKTLPIIPFDSNDPDVWDTKADDDDVDALAYFANTRQIKDDTEEYDKVLDWMTVRHGGKTPPTNSGINW